jgi:hypothetical protein
MKPRPVSLIIIYSLFHVLALLSTWFKFCAVGGESHLYRTLYLPHVLPVLKGTTDSLSCVLGNDEIECQLRRDRLMAKNEVKM